MKKAMNYLAMFLFFFVLILLVAAFIKTQEKYNQFKQEVGENQAEVIHAYQEGERILLYTDTAADYASEIALKELPKQIQSSCGSFSMAPIVFNGKECRITKSRLQEALTEIFNQEMDNYIDIYPGDIPKNNYYLMIGDDNKTIYGSATKEIRLPNYDKKTILARQQDKDCYAKGYIYSNTCEVCKPETKCEDYKTEDNCKIDPCNLICDWNNNICVAATLTYKIKPSFSSLTSQDFTEYRVISKTITDMASCNKEECFKNSLQSQTDYKLDSCISEDEAKFALFYDSLGSCAESIDNDCRCIPNFKKNEFILNNKDQFRLSDSTYSGILNFKNIGVLEDYSSLPKLKVVENIKLTIGSGFTTDISNDITTEVYKNNGLYFVSKKTASSKDYKALLECTPKYKKFQVCYKDYRFAVALQP